MTVVNNDMSPELITIKGIDQLSEKERSIVKNLVNKRFDKIERETRNETSIKVVVKEYDKEGKRKKYSVDITVTSATKRYKSKEAGWDLAKALNKSLDKVQTEIEHKLHSSDQHNKIKLREPLNRKF